MNNEYENSIKEWQSKRNHNNNELIASLNPDLSKRLDNISIDLSTRREQLINSNKNNNTDGFNSFMKKLKETSSAHIENIKNRRINSVKD